MFNRSSLVQYLTTISWAISHWQNKHHLISVHISGWSHMLIFPKLPQSCLINPCFVGKSPLLYSSCLRLIRHPPRPHGNTKKTCPGTTTQIAPLSESPETQSSESYGIFYDQSIHGDFQWGYGAPLRCKKCSQCLDWNLGWKEYMDHLHRKLWGRSLKNQGIRPIWFLEAYHLVGGRLSDDYPLPQKMRRPNVRSMYPLVN